MCVLIPRSSSKIASHASSPRSLAACQKKMLGSRLGGKDGLVCSVTFSHLILSPSPSSPYPMDALKLPCFRLSGR